ncbi:hypothetical protein [Nonomuraea diastatica]|uniref:Uncharacterized protein n=1 Tax=Nonomuraea diastatica TaxID=1848329 RepID=A0A4R4WVD5_9ACTN|nr:hypothetical protein [Nonomuraea diastatica]TDD21592.1 hypothetical protein E1294_14210 [Nonomuraea diastatica]
MKRSKAWAAAVAGAVLAGGVLTSAFTMNGVQSRGDGGGTGGVVLAHGSDRLPSHTASDWVTYADHVVVVTAEAERELPASEDERAAGQGYLPREVTLAVKETLWSRQGAAKPVPEPRFVWPAAGWTFGEDGRRLLAMEGQPRIEVGHTYILAIAWVPGYTDDGEVVPGQWRGLGEKSLLPYDDGVIGNGESEGRLTTATSDGHDSAVAEPDGPSLEEEMRGRPAADLAAGLKAAQPGERQQFGRPR